MLFTFAVFDRIWKPTFWNFFCKQIADKMDAFIQIKYGKKITIVLSVCIFLQNGSTTSKDLS